MLQVVQCCPQPGGMAVLQVVQCCPQPGGMAVLKFVDACKFLQSTSLPYSSVEVEL